MKKQTLKNGLSVIIDPRPKTKTVAICLTVKSGSANENVKNNGVSHFLEHILLDGTENRPDSKTIATEIESLGGVLNGETDKESTSFFVFVEDRWFSKGVNLIADIIQNPLFAQRDIEKEHKVVMQEYLQMDQDEPGHVVHDLFENSLFKGSTLAMPIIGTKKTINSMSKNTLKDYYNHYYVPNNMILSVVGNIDFEESLSEVGRAFGDMRRGRIEKDVVFDPLRGVSAQKTKDISQNHVMLGVPTASLENRDVYALEVMEAYLSAGISGKLVQEIREKRGLAYSVCATDEVHPSYGHFSSHLVTGERNLEMVTGLVKSEFRSLSEVPLSSKELENAKNFVQGRLVLHNESNLKLAKFYNMFECIGKAELADKFVDNIGAVTSEDVMDTAGRYFKDENYCLAVLKPKS